jgi:hypothetical protein
MKKALLILLVLSIVGAAAFADVKFGAFAAIGARVDYQMNAGGSTNNVDRLYAWEWFQGTPLIGLATLSFVGADPNVGYDTRVINVGGNPPITGYPFTIDYANVWSKVMNGMVLLNLGLYQAAEDFETAEQAYGQNEWNSGNTPAFTVYIYPIEGLVIGYQLPLNVSSTLATGSTVSDTLWNSHIGVRYTMKDVFGVTAGYLLAKANNTSDAYFGVSVNAVPNLNLWFEGLMVNMGNSVTGESDLYLEANYPIAMFKIGVAFEYNMPSASGLNAGWVFEPYVIYPVADKINLMAAIDVGSAPTAANMALGATNVWGWYGLQTGGSANTDNGIAWDLFVRASMMSPLGEFRVQAKYGQYDSKITSNVPAYFQRRSR